jgi:hypothetical protein
MSSSWTNKVEHVIDGESVEAKVDSRPTRALENQARYLKERVDGIENKEALVIYDSAVEADATLGMAVCWNGTRSRFERALAGFEFNQDTKILETSPLCEVIGIILYKHGPEVADILIFGKGEIDITGVIDGGGDLSPGRYYLSGKTRGKLSTKPAIADVAVLHADGNGIVYVQPQLRDGPYNHVHYEFSLNLSPCGDSPTPSPDGRHSIINVDDSLPGWLPADDAFFNGLAPTGAAFGYNLKTHVALYNVFPPMPAESASVTWFKGDTDGNGIELPLGIKGVILIDINGIWWMSDCYNDVPWSYQHGASSSSSSSSGSLSLSVPECPRDMFKKMLLRFAKTAYGVDKTVVTSLEAVEGSGITVIGCYDNLPASTGALKLDLDLGLTVDDDTFEGSLVFKEIEGGKFKRGRVIEGIRVEDESITISSTSSRVGDDDVTIHQGIVTMSANVASAERIIQPQVVRLSDTKERYYEDIMYLAFPSVQASSIRLKVLMPHADAFPAAAKLKLRLRLLGRSAGTLSSLTVTYRVLSKSDGSPVDLPLVDEALVIDTSVTVAADQYIDIDSEDILEIAGEDIVYFTVARTAADGYGGEVGLIEAVAVIY